MLTARKLSEEWISKFRELRVAKSMRTPKDFSKILDIVIKDAVRSTIKNVTNLTDEQEIENRTQRALDKMSNFLGESGNLGQLKRDQDELYRNFQLLNDNRRQIDWATTRDHVKVTLWRTMQTILIAIIVLCTGYVAKVLEIPLPFLRIL